MVVFKYIRLAQGERVKVDIEDFARLSKYNWSAMKGRQTFYAVRFVEFKGLYDTNLNSKHKYKCITVSMARQIMGLSNEDPRVPDHKNHNGLDNRKSNLRICTTSQNAYNRKKRRGSKNRYIGVYKARTAGKWTAWVGGKYAGTYNTQKEAAIARDKEAVKIRGEFAYTNFG